MVLLTIALGYDKVILCSGNSFLRRKIMKIEAQACGEAPRELTFDELKELMEEGWMPSSITFGETRFEAICPDCGGPEVEHDWKHGCACSEQT